MNSPILPLRPILKDLFSNFWHLRLIFIAMLVAFLVSAGILFLVERDELAPNQPPKTQFLIALAKTASDVLPSQFTTYKNQTVIGTSLMVANSLLGLLLFGIAVWIAQQSLSGHRLKKSTLLFFPTDEDAT